jgi:ribosomal protein S18 acetylase RimI-like enzyme
VIALRHLEWDSAFFGLRVARVEGHRLGSEDVAAVDGWARAERVDCLYFLADAADAGTLARAEAAGFERVDERITLEASPLPRAIAARTAVRSAVPADIDALEEIAATAHQDTRFFNDRRFPRERSVELYRTWIRNSCQGWADSVFVTEDAGRPAGYATVHLREGGVGEIGLLGVAEAARGRGHGQALVQEALRWLGDRGSGRARVVTQGGNHGALRLYQAAGFSVARSEVWYHRWAAQGSQSPPS